MKSMLCLSLFLVLSCMLLSASARSLQETEDLLLQLLDREYAHPERHICDNITCGSGTCGGGEDPNNWGQDYYCHSCGTTYGGQHCEFSDPCGQLSSSNPCTTDAAPICYPSSFHAPGYECASEKKSLRRDIMDMLESPQTAEFRNLRLRMAKSDKPLEVVRNYLRSLF